MSSETPGERVWQFATLPIGGAIIGAVAAPVVCTEKIAGIVPHTVYDCPLVGTVDPWLGYTGYITLGTIVGAVVAFFVWVFTTPSR